jgi:hypothetical protein
MISISVIDLIAANLNINAIKLFAATAYINIKKDATIFTITFLFATESAETLNFLLCFCAISGNTSIIL